MKTILFVHQPVDLYSLDKVLLWLIKGLDKRKFRLIAILPFEGPIAAVLRESGIEVYGAPLVRADRKT